MKQDFLIVFSYRQFLAMIDRDFWIAVMADSPCIRFTRLMSKDFEDTFFLPVPDAAEIVKTMGGFSLTSCAPDYVELNFSSTKQFLGYSFSV